jgi:polysaccharide export outer membrane protein
VRWLPRTYSAFEFMSAKLAEDPSGLGKYLLNTRNGISWKHQWSKSFTTVASTNLNRTIYAGTSRKDDVLGISVTANYNFRRWLTTGVDFQHRLQSSDPSANNRVVIMFTATLTLELWFSKRLRQETDWVSIRRVGAPRCARSIASHGCRTGKRRRRIALVAFWSLTSHGLFPHTPQANSSWTVPAGAIIPAYLDVASLLSTHKLAAGDVIDPCLRRGRFSRERSTSDAGTIPYPALGELKALGLTIGELERTITKGLKAGYLVNPRVSVQIEEYRPFFINGMVERPGSYPFQPGLTVFKASTLAGGFKERASFGKISIIREGNVKAGAQKADLDTPVYPGDTVFIDESFF